MSRSSCSDRTPTKLTISISPQLNSALYDYAAVYGATYGRAESVTELIPYMLRAFLESDRVFMRSQTRS